MSVLPNSRAGRLLYSELPEEHRYRDTPVQGEMGDLAAYLDGFGWVLDTIRGTFEQLYTDSFAEPVEPFSPGEKERKAQDWILPYLADILGAELIAADSEGRRSELANAIDLNRRRGTLRALDKLSDGFSTLETVTVEGLTRVAATIALSGPLNSRGGTPAATTPDFRRCSRMVRTETVEAPSQRGYFPQRGADGRSLPPLDVAWCNSARFGLPCFPGSFEDMAVRTADLREPDAWRGHAHPHRIVVHVRSPWGFFIPGLREITPSGGTLALAIPTDETAAEFSASNIVPGLPHDLDRLTIKGDLTVAGVGDMYLSDINIMGILHVAAGCRLHLNRVAARGLSVAPGSVAAPGVAAHDCLFETVVATGAAVLFEYVTVLKTIVAHKLQASDCIFAGIMMAEPPSHSESCVRYSRISPNGTSHAGMTGIGTNTSSVPRFEHFEFCEKPHRLRAAVFGEPGAGVLALDCPASILSGAEDGQELGAYHHARHAATLSLLERKLLDHVQAGLDVVLMRDVRLASPPPIQKP